VEKNKKGEIISSTEVSHKYRDVGLLAENLMWLFYKDDLKKDSFAKKDKDVKDRENECSWNNLAVNIYLPIQHKLYSISVW
jgi:hypothetical protein